MILFRLFFIDCCFVDTNTSKSNQQHGKLWSETNTIQHY